MTASKLLAQTDLADRLGITTRQVRSLVTRGLPKTGEGPSAKHPWPAARDWYNAYLERQAEAKYRPTDLDALRARKLEADARLAEIEVAKAEATLVPFDVHEQRVGALCDRLRGVLMTIPSKYLGRIQVARTDLEAQAVGEQIRDDTLRALQGTADAEDADDDAAADVA